MRILFGIWNIKRLQKLFLLLKSFFILSRAFSRVTLEEKPGAKITGIYMQLFFYILINYGRFYGC